MSVTKYRGKQEWFEPLPKRPTTEGPLIAESVIDDVAEMVAAGKPFNVACTRNGLSPQSVSRWVRKAQEAEANGEDSHYIRWAAKMHQAHDAYHGTLVDLLMQGAQKDGKLVLEILRRRFPETWAEPAVQLEVRVNKMSDEELEARKVEIMQSLVTQGLLTAGEDKDG